MLFKHLQSLPFFVRRLPLHERFGTEFACRCFSVTANVQKKSSKQNNDDETDAERLKREAPYLFRVVSRGTKTEPKSSSKTRKSPPANYEPPFVFKAIKVKNNVVLDDDISHLGTDSMPRVSQKENVFIVQPYYKQGQMRSKLVSHRLGEAEALIKSVHHTWGVHTGVIEPVQQQRHHPRFFFGSGKVLELSTTIRDAINNEGVTMVFLNTEQLTLRQSEELQATWGCKVFDRYRVVLELFKERAQTKEAKLQVQLAEIQYMRSHHGSEADERDFQRVSGAMGMGGPGEKQRELMRRKLNGQEARTKKSLAALRASRALNKANRIKKRVPSVAMVGYTNAGKTTLAKALSRDDSLQAEDKLFATLDTTAHGGRLPNGLGLVYLDTVGFISELPHHLVESFSTTLEDVTTADVIVHICDVSHPELDLQEQTVLDVLGKLDIPAQVMENRITVYNKIDKSAYSHSQIDNKPDVVAVSATEGTGIEELRNRVEGLIMELSRRKHYRVNLDLSTAHNQLAWLYKNGTVMDTIHSEDDTFDIVVILDEAAKATFQAAFKDSKLVLNEDVMPVQERDVFAD